MNPATPAVARGRASPWRPPLAVSRSAWRGGVFTLFSSLRVVAYIPTLSAIHASGNASQHSLWTWLIFCGANLSMALWLHERAGSRLDRHVVVSAINATMCGAVVVLILGYRI